MKPRTRLGAGLGVGVQRPWGGGRKRLWTPARSPYVRFWYDPSDPASCTWSGSNLVSLGNKGSVGGAVDTIASVTQGDIGGRIALRFSGAAGQRCRQTTGDTGVTGPIAVLVVRKIAAPLSQFGIIYDAQNVTQRITSYVNAGNSLHHSRAGTDRSYAYTVTADAVIEEAIHQLNEHFGSYESRAAINGASYSNGSTGTDGGRIIGWNIGHTQANAAPLTGDVGEIVVFQGEAGVGYGIDTNEILACRQYLARRHGNIVTADTHRLVSFDGNSLVAGFGTPDPPNDCPPGQLRSLLGVDWTPWHVYADQGDSGHKWTDMAGAEFAVEIGSRYRAGASRNVLIAYADTNELGSLGLSAAEVAAQKWTYFDAARAAGFETWCGTCVKFSGSPAAEVQRQQLNAMTIADGPAHCAGVIDFASCPELLNNADLTYFQADGTHLTAAGCGVMAAAAAAAVNP